MLTNIEVLELIAQNQASRDKLKDKDKDRRQEFRQRDFTEGQLQSLLGGLYKGVTSASIAEYLRAIKASNIPFKPEELIQLANIIPKAEVELHVAFGDGRFTEEQILQLIELSSIARKESS